jgi:hypothetical protein
MSRPLLYLTVTSVWNRLRVRVSRLRQPRYLAGVVVAGAYFSWFLFGQRPASGRATGSALEVATRYHDAMVLVGSVALLAFVTLYWVWPGPRRLRLGFSRADVQFLLTAPIPRADVLRYKLLRAQLGALFGAAIMTVFLRPGGLTSGWVFWVGMTAFMAAVNLHVAGASLWLHDETQSAGRQAWRRWPQLALLISCGAVIAAAAGSVRSNTDGAVELGSLMDRLVTDLSAGAAGIALWPWKALVELPLSSDPGEFLRHLPVVLGILVVNYVWVTRSHVPFEEAAADMAERRTNALSGPQPTARRSAHGGRVPFELAPVGRPEVAVLWKNLLMLGRHVSVSLVVRVVAVLVIIAVASSRGERSDGIVTAVTSVATIAMLMGTFVGPQLVRHDLRQDLAYLETLKLWPLRGAEIVRGEVLAPTIVLVSVVWTAAVVGTAMAGDWWTEGPAWMTGGQISWAVSAMLVTAGLIFLQVIAHNAIAIAFPAWARIGAGRAQGIDVMGQRMLMLAGMLATVMVAALPAAFVGAAVAAVAYAVTGTVPVLALAAAAAVTFLVEGIVATEALGSLLERTDATAIDAAE